MTPHRHVKCPVTGRIGWPDVVQYRIVDGPHAGTVLNYPPLASQYPAPRRIDPHTGRDTTPPGTAAFRILIRDHDAYEDLARTGLLYSDEHNGRRGAVDDNRRTA